MIVYETICATFLLNLVNDGHDETTALGRYFAQALRRNNAQNVNQESDDVNIHDVVKHLTALGAKEQLPMFLTGPTGAGKTTAVKLAQRFCFEFSNAVSIMWSDRTFLFTAYTGSAASCFGGVTICKAAFLNKKKVALTPDEIDDWKDVRILVIDEISFMQDTEILELGRQLK